MFRCIFVKSMKSEKVVSIWL